MLGLLQVRATVLGEKALHWSLQGALTALFQLQCLQRPLGSLGDSSLQSALVLCQKHALNEACCVEPPTSTGLGQLTWKAMYRMLCKTG
jgi:hypothetical protein